MGSNFHADGEGKLILELKWKGEDCKYLREVKLTRLKPYQQVSLDLKIGDEKKVEREKVFKELLKFREREYPDEDTDEDWVTIKDIKKVLRMSEENICLGDCNNNNCQIKGLKDFEKELKIFREYFWS